MLGSSSYRVPKASWEPNRQKFFTVIRCSNSQVGLSECRNDDSLLHVTADENASLVDGHKLQHTPQLSESRQRRSWVIPWRLCTVTQVEELKVIVGMLPIWATGIVYFSVLAQFSSTFLEQGRTMNTQVVGGFAIPAASLASFDAVSVIFWCQSTTGSRPSSQAAHRQCPWPLGAAALRRRPFPLGHGDGPRRRWSRRGAWRWRTPSARRGEVAMAMSILWQVPQYFLVGASVVFACVGQTEFFYNEAPRSMRSLCSALALLTVALGSYLSSLV
ncbi:hypothetical protein HU200_064436 [Digitaria exilis]|uniref:Uncharacterized protein n=1 Tax=Digitaria exilis TaxID=1010633 RepID=A0A835A5I9_9POAL|nr:hypothetical protein HU200_064436 [Digitaria exilis]